MGSSRNSRSRPAITIGGRIFLTFFPGFFAALGGLLTWFIGQSGWKTARTYFWQKTPCTIVESRKEAAGVERTSSDTHPFTLRYAYQVGGKEYISGSVNSGGLDDDRKNSAYLLSRYQKGDQASCWVDPQNPASAVLERESAWLTLVIVFPLVSLAIGVGGIIAVWRTKWEWDSTSRKGVSRKKSEAGDRAASAVFLAVGLVFLALIVGLPGWKVWSARSWLETPCTILSSRVAASRGSDTTYRPDITYSYAVNGREYVSASYDLIQASSSGYGGKAAVVNRYPPGANAVCYVNPRSPWEAVLNRAPSPILLFGIIPLIFVALGASGLVSAAKKRAAAAGAALPRATGE